MAITTVLRMTFVDDVGKTKNFNVRYANSNVTSLAVKSLMNTITQNSDVFASRYTLNKAAKIIQTDTTDIDLSDV